MSEAYLEVKVQFSSREFRDKAIEFLNDEGPTFEDEVEELFRPLFILQDEVKEPEEIEPIKDTTLFALFEVFGGEGIDNAQEYMESFDKCGATKIYGFFVDDEQTELGWIIQDHKLVTFYTGYEGDNETAELISDLDEEDKLDKLIELFESGELKAEI